MTTSPSSIISGKNTTPSGSANNSPPTSPRDKPDIEKNTPTLRNRISHNPLFLSMLTCGNMQDCDQVNEIYTECQRTQSDSGMCEAAEIYHRMCHSNPNVLRDTHYDL